MLFYQRQALLAAPISLFRLREGGMSLHGGLLGVLIALWLYAQGVKS
jgi:phosphatidylglycerol:prolipoprotein diacylglycerol transferase